MNIKKYLPSLGVIILLVTSTFGLLFVNWILSPLSYEKALKEEKKGHKLAKLGKNRDALQHFLMAAEIDDDSIKRSNRYLWAASTDSNKQNKIKYYKLSLEYNQDNHIAKRRLRNLLIEKK